MVNDTTLLFGLDGVQVVRVMLDDDENPILALVTASEQARCCPGCGMRSQHAHSWVRTRPRDLPVAGRRTALTWTKRRWRCRNAACERATFTESVPQIPPRARLTGRLRASIGAAVADRGRTVIQAARDHEVSWPIAQTAFAAHTRLALPAETPQVARLGIDEIRRGKARFRLVPGEGGDEKWEVVADKWHVGMVDLGGGAGLLGQVEGRTAETLSAWIEAQSPQWRAGVQVVAIDMCTVFKAAIRTSLPHAALVVDRFHVAQLANTALTEVRRRVTVQARGRRGRKGNREWELRNRLTRAGTRMHAKHLDPMIDDLRALPAKIGIPILKAWNVKEDLMDLLALHGTHPDRAQISALLIRFYENAAACGLPEITRLAGTVSTWWPQILAAITTGVTNAGSEGTNRVIKTDARTAYGYRNPANQRLRARAATTRRARGHLTTHTSGPHAQPRRRSKA
ncbi:ISL3 family transposase [Actinospica robiniae]|uniref:ISL3 family transposase n=1 Tax=Actinospica robiniae TaxID=304901 RepID=UPI000411CB64|nr:ISL3 family transposase [Actinospica robiniae]